MNNPRKIFVEIAREEVGTRETSRNQGPGIAKYWTATTYKDGFKNREPYCAAFVCWVCAEAERRGHGVGPVPNSAAVRHIVSWARGLNRGATVFNAGSKLYEPQAGDLVWWAFNGSQPNHIGIVARKDGINQIVTVEANTNPAGSREGDGVYERKRSISGAGGFIRLAWKATGVTKS
jgi:GNAT superfamily N-acetyltransferase